MIKLALNDAGVSFAVRVQPRASKSGVAGEFDGALKIRLAAPPVDGAANEELIRFLAKLLGAPRADVSIVSGSTGKNKIVRVIGLSAEVIERKLDELLSR